MQIYGLDTYKSGSLLDEAAIKHRNEINKNNSAQVANAQKKLEQDQTQRAEQAQQNMSVPTTNQPTSTPQPTPTPSSANEPRYNFASISAQRVSEAAQELRLFGEEDLGAYLEEQLETLNMRFSQYLPTTPSGQTDRAAPFNFLFYLQQTRTQNLQQAEPSSLLSATQDQLFQRLKVFHQGIDEMA